MENNNKKQTPVNGKTQKKVGVVKTYAEDIVKGIEKGEGGIIKKIIHEQEEHEAVKKNLSPESKRNKLFMLVSLVLVVLAFILIVSFVMLKNQISTVSVETQFTPIIFTDKTEYKEIAGLAKEKIAQTILNEISTTNLKNGGVEGLYLTETKKIIGLRRFIALLKGNFVLDQNSFVDDNFLIGIVNKGNIIDGVVNKNLFILLKTRSFIDIFPAMKSWENKMFYDLHGFFGIDVNADTNYLLTKNFEDGIVGNKNARILRDKDGKVVLEYVFADDTSLIITNKDDTAGEIITRLSAGQIKK